VNFAIQRLSVVRRRGPVFHVQRVRLYFKSSFGVPNNKVGMLTNLILS
jgi:hypothetical protein